MVSKTDRKRIDAANEAFHKYYSAGHGWDAERWHSTLYPALSRPVRQCSLLNAFLDDVQPQDGTELVQLPSPNKTIPGEKATPQTLQAYTLPPPPPPPLTTLSPPHRRPDLLSHYNLDASSLLPVLLLTPTPAETILDLCASPGGKSLALSHHLFTSPPSPSLLHSNELDPHRASRLRHNLSSYLPAALLSSGAVRTSSLDATAASFPGQVACDRVRRAGGWDKVLLDAPCSSERHVVHSAVAAARAGTVSKEMVGFRASAVGKKGVVKVQVELLMNALRCVRVGGRVVYSTCSIDRIENEGVVGKVLERVGKGKEGFAVQVQRVEDVLEGVKEWSEEREQGRICLPDLGGGWGPLYFCAFRKVSVEKHEERKT